MTITNAAKVAKYDHNDDVDDNVDPAARPTRRILSVEEKLDILARYEACELGQKGEFARREGVYSSQLTEWRRARDAGTLGAKRSTRTRGENREIEKLTKKNQRLVSCVISSFTLVASPVRMVHDTIGDDAGVGAG